MSWINASIYTSVKVSGTGAKLAAIDTDFVDHVLSICRAIDLSSTSRIVPDAHIIVFPSLSAVQEERYDFPILVSASSCEHFTRRLSTTGNAKEVNDRQRGRGQRPREKSMNKTDRLVVHLLYRASRYNWPDNIALLSI